MSSVLGALEMECLAVGMGMASAFPDGVSCSYQKPRVTYWLAPGETLSRVGPLVHLKAVVPLC